MCGDAEGVRRGRDIAGEGLPNGISNRARPRARKQVWPQRLYIYPDSISRHSDTSAPHLTFRIEHDWVWAIREHLPKPHALLAPRF